MKNLLIVSILNCLILSGAFAAEHTLTATGGSVSFLAIGKPSAIKIRGEGSAPQGQIEVTGKQVLGTLSFDLNTLHTGIDLRDKHMREKYLQTEKYPTAKLKITKLDLPANFKSDGFKAEGVPFEGELTLHGETRPVKGTTTITSAGGQSTSHVEFGTEISQYKIDVPTYMGIKVADHVDVQVDLTAKPASAK